MKDKEEDNFEIPERRARIVDALNAAIEIFTSHSEKEFDDVISKGLKPIADAANLDRVVFYRRLSIEGEIRFGQIYSWDKAKSGLVSLDDEQLVLPGIPVMERWISILSNGDRIRICESDMAEDEAAFLRTFGVKSILIVPVFSHGEFWGAVALQNHTSDTYFDEGCADLLYSAAHLCANAIIRAEVSRNAVEAVEALKRREKMANILNEMAVMFLSQSEESFEAMMTEGVRLIADMIELDRMSVWRNFDMPDGLHSAQIYRWEKKSGGTTVPIAELKDIYFQKLVPTWENILKSGGTINGPARLQPESEVASLRKFGTVSLFVTPVFINNAFWGMAIFEDLFKERYFEKDYTEIMRSAAFLCSNTIIRTDMERSISSTDEFNRAVVDAARIGFTAFDENMNIIGVNNASLELFECERQYYIDHFFEFAPEYQPDGATSREKAIDLIARALNGENILFEWTHLTPAGKLIPFEITLTRAKYREKYMVLSYQYDLRHTREMTEKLKKTERIT